MKHLLSSLTLFAALSFTTAFAQQSPVFVQSGKAIRGYDPVAYFTEAKPVLGDSAITYSYRGATWQFAPATNKDRPGFIRKADAN